MTAAMLAMSASTAAAQSSRDAMPVATRAVAYFSVQRVFAESADGKAVRAALAARQADASKEIEARTARLRSQREELQRSLTVLAPAAVAAREQEIERFQLDLQRFTEDAQAEFLGIQRAAESTFLARLRPAVLFARFVVRRPSLQ
jgi:Skp family chaperone for outer membrane proteins